MPLEGFRVLDVSTVIAALLAAMVLGDFGADVIKIEHPIGGDPARTHGDRRDEFALASPTTRTDWPGCRPVR